MAELCDAVNAGDLERVQLLIEQGVDKNQFTNEDWSYTALSAAVIKGNLDIIRYLVEQGADMETTGNGGNTPLIFAADHGHLEAVRYLLEQGANRDKAAIEDGHTPLHCAVEGNHLEITKLLMSYGADLNIRNKFMGYMPIDLASDDDIIQAIRDEPRRRMDHGHKRAVEQDRQPNAAASASAQQEEDEEEVEQSNKKPRLDEGAEPKEGEVADEDQDSEPSDVEDNWDHGITSWLLLWSNFLNCWVLTLYLLYNLYIVYNQISFD